MMMMIIDGIKIRNIFTFELFFCKDFEYQIACSGAIFKITKKPSEEFSFKF